MRQPQRDRAARAVVLGLAFLLTMAAADEAGAQTATGQLLDLNNAAIGTVTLTQMAKGVRVAVEATRLPPGVHAFHIHAVGLCEPPFTSAGGHFNPTGAQHGWNNPEGHHAGDLANVHVAADGVLAIEAFTDAVTLSEGDHGLFDADGASIVLHAGPDDNHTDPAGNAGDRIACAVVVPTG